MKDCLRMQGLVYADLIFALYLEHDENVILTRMRCRFLGEHVGWSTCGTHSFLRHNTVAKAASYRMTIHLLSGQGR